MPSLSLAWSRSSSVLCRAHAKDNSTKRSTRSYERVLSYPDASPRILRYPIAEEEDDYGMEEYVLPCLDWQDSCPYPMTVQPNLGARAPSQMVDAQESLELDETSWFKELQELTRKAEDIRKRVSQSYQVLQGCPWVLPRPLFALVISSFDDSSKLYTVRARLPKEDVRDELAMVLNNSSLSSSLAMYEMRDGAVVFDQVEDAETYSSSLEQDLGYRVGIINMDSHELFRMMNEVQGVVVHVPHSDFVPQPHQLATAVMGKGAWEEN